MCKLKPATFHSQKHRHAVSDSVNAIAFSCTSLFPSSVLKTGYLIRTMTYHSLKKGISQISAPHFMVESSFNKKPLIIQSNRYGFWRDTLILSCCFFYVSMLRASKQNSFHLKCFGISGMDISKSGQIKSKLHAWVWVEIFSVEPTRSCRYTGDKGEKEQGEMNACRGRKIRKNNPKKTEKAGICTQTDRNMRK